jgi:hypothetical protein
MRAIGASRKRESVRVIQVVGTENGAAWMHEQVRELRTRGYDATALRA